MCLPPVPLSPSVANRYFRHPLLDVGRAEPVRDLGPEARRADGDIAGRFDRSAPPSRAWTSARCSRCRPGIAQRLADRAVAASHDVVAQRRLDRGADRQDADGPDPTSTAKSEHPDFGMIASRCRGLRPDGLPQYVGIPTAPFMTRPTYLGLSHQGFAAGDPSLPGYAPPGLRPRRRRRSAINSTIAAGC